VLAKVHQQFAGLLGGPSICGEDQVQQPQ
jgi:hypothetical protein